MCRLRRSWSPPPASGEGENTLALRAAARPQLGGCSPSGVGTGQWEKGSVKGVLWQQRVVKVLGVTDRSSPALLHIAKLKPTFRNIFLWSLVPLHVADIPSCHCEYKPGRVRHKIHPIQKNIKEKLKYSEILPCYLSNLDVFITYEG